MPSLKLAEDDLLSYCGLGRKQFVATDRHVLWLYSASLPSFTKPLLDLCISVASRVMGQKRQLCNGNFEMANTEMLCIR